MWTVVVALVAAYVIAAVSTPAGVSGAVLLHRYWGVAIPMILLTPVCKDH